MDENKMNEREGQNPEQAKEKSSGGVIGCGTILFLAVAGTLGRQVMKAILSNASIPYNALESVGSFLFTILLCVGITLFSGLSLGKIIKKVHQQRTQKILLPLILRCGGKEKLLSAALPNILIWGIAFIAIFALVLGSCLGSHGLLFSLCFFAGVIYALISKREAGTTIDDVFMYTGATYPTDGQESADVYKEYLRLMGE